ncbi:hypothetical protein F5B21DRAFT_93750 [Xylaria acuta]|nr:hypothetical protein F5B21DRAFT_93750 [Xylaria acuta]
MTRFLVPPWFHLPTPTLDDFLAASVIWGFTLGAAFFTAIQAWSQPMAIWRKSHKIQAYVLLIWGEWLSSMGLGILAWTVIVGRVFPDFLVSIIAASLWVLQIQCICGIIINRISLITANKRRINILRWSVAFILGLINISVFVIWIPARLQISPTWIRINDV